MVQYSEQQRNKGSNETEMNEQDNAADNIFSFEEVTLAVYMGQQDGLLGSLSF